MAAALVLMCALGQHLLSPFYGWNLIAETRIYDHLHRVDVVGEV